MRYYRFVVVHKHGFLSAVKFFLEINGYDENGGKHDDYDLTMIFIIEKRYFQCVRTDKKRAYNFMMA